MKIGDLVKLELFRRNPFGYSVLHKGKVYDIQNATGVVISLHPPPDEKLFKGNCQVYLLNEGFVLNICEPKEFTVVSSAKIDKS